MSTMDQSIIQLEWLKLSRRILVFIQWKAPPQILPLPMPSTTAKGKDFFEATQQLWGFDTNRLGKVSRAKPILAQQTTAVKPAKRKENNRLVGNSGILGPLLGNCGVGQTQPWTTQFSTCWLQVSLVARDQQVSGLSSNMCHVRFDLNM